MMQDCFTMAGMGPGWLATVALIAAAVSVTYLLTKRADSSWEGTSE